MYIGRWASWMPCQCRRCMFGPWVGNIPWRRNWHPTPVFLPGKHMDREAWWATVPGVTKRDMTERLNNNNKYR